MVRRWAQQGQNKTKLRDTLESVAEARTMSMETDGGGPEVKKAGMGVGD